MLRRIAYVLGGLFLLFLIAAWIVIFDPFRPADIRAMTQIRSELQASGRLSSDEKQALFGRCVQVADNHPNTVGGATCLLLAATRLSDQDRDGAMQARIGKFLEEGDLELIDAACYRHLGNFQQLDDQAPLLLKRLKAQPDHPQAAALAARVSQMSLPGEEQSPSPTFVAAADLIRDHFAVSPDITPFCETILEKNQDRAVRCTAQFAKAQLAMSVGEERQEEALSLFEEFLADFDGKTPYGYLSIEQNYRDLAERQRSELRFRATGKPAPDLHGVDLNGNEIHLKDFQGKATLVVFWGTWCYPCMQLVPQERELVSRFANRKFALVGVNCDDEIELATAAAQEHQMTWPSIQNHLPNGSQITEEWRILGYPTLYLIDHHGVIRRRWIGPPPNELLDAAIELLVDAADNALPPDEMAAVAKELAAIAKSTPTQANDARPDGDSIANDPRFCTFDFQDAKLGASKYVVYQPLQVESGAKFPAILFLHGDGAQGSDGKRHLGQGLPAALASMDNEFPLIAIFPQALNGEDWQAERSGGQRALRILDRVQEVYPIDKDRIILSGFSMGGEGTWSLGAAHPERWAAIVPIAHGWQPQQAEKLAKLPCWAFHSADDEMIAASHSRDMLSAVQAKEGKPLYTEFSGLTHTQSAQQAYLQPELIEWMLLQRRAMK